MTFPSELSWRDVADTAREPLLVLDAGRRVVFANRAFRRAFAADAGAVDGRRLADGRWDVPELRRLIEEVLPRSTTVEDFEVEHVDPGTGRRVMRLNARRTEDGAFVLLAVEDVTGRADRERARAREHDLTRDLLAEVNHRVKNSLQLISSVVGLEGAGVGDPAAAAVIDRLSGRIRAFADLYETLSTTGRQDEVELGGYLERLCGGIRASVGGDHRVTIAAVPLRVGFDDAVSIGVLVNELVTNALKYAFVVGQAGEVTVRLADHGSLRLSVTDDGRGIPGDLRAEASSGIGVRLVGLFVRRLGGELERRSGPDGTAYAITLPERLIRGEA